MKLSHNSGSLNRRVIVLLQVCALAVSPSAYALSKGNPLKLETAVYAAEPSQTEKIREGLEEGAKLYRERKWNEAIQVWKKVLELDPDNARAKRYIERAEMKLAQQSSSARPAVMPAVSEKPKEKPVLKTAPSPLIKSQKTEETDGDVEKWTREGVAFYREGNYTEALKKWNQVLVKDPENERIKRYIARAIKKQAQTSEKQPPLQKIEKVEKIQPVPKVPEKIAPEPKPVAGAAKKTEPLLEEGKKLYRAGKYKDAISKWNEVLSLDSENRAAKRYINRAEKKLASAKKPEPKTKKKMVQKPAPKPKAKPMPAAKAEHPVASAKAADRSVPLPLSVKTIGKVEGDIYDYGTLDLESAIKLGLANHGPVKVNRKEIKLAKMRLIEARRARFPGVNLKNGIIEGTSTDEDFEGLEFTAEFQLPIMTGGRIKNSIRQAEANVAVSIKNYEKTRADFVAELEQAFYALSNAKRVYRERLKLFEEANIYLTQINKQYKAGLARQLDLLNIQNQYNDIKFQITSSEKDLELAYLTLHQLLDLKENEIFDIQELQSYSLLDIEFEKALQIGLNRRPDIKLAELQVLFNKYAVKVAEAQNRFRVEMNASIGLNDQFFVESESLDLETEFFVGIKATKPMGMHVIENNFIIQDKVPAAGQTTSSQFGSNNVSLGLFNNTAKTGITEAKIQYMRARGELKKQIKTTKFEVRQNFFEYQKALAQLDGAITRLKLGEEEVKILKAQAQLNQAQLLDVMRASVRKYDAIGNLAQAVTSYFTAISNLNKAIGVVSYYNPITGETGDKLHRELFKPINKPRYKIFTQLTKDRPKEDIMTFRPEDVTADALLEKERRKELLFNNNFAPFAPLKVIPGLSTLFTPRETQEKFLSTYYLPPDKPLAPFKIWQVGRYPALGLFEYETIIDEEEIEKPEPTLHPASESEKTAPETLSSNVKQSHPGTEQSSGNTQLSSIQILDEPKSVRIVLNKKGAIDFASYSMEDPSRLVFVLNEPAKANKALASVEVPDSIVKGVRFHKKDQYINAFVIDMDRQAKYKVNNQRDSLVVSLEKPE